MIPSKSLLLGAAVALSLSVSPARAFNISFGNDIPSALNNQATGIMSFDSVTPVFSTVTDFNFIFDISAPLEAGRTYSEADIATIQYNVAGALGMTPSGFPQFRFQVNHLFDGPTSLRDSITGAEFLSLNVGNLTNPLDPGDVTLPQPDRLRFTISAFADLSDGVQLDELDVLSPDYGMGTIFHFNAREGTAPVGRYHPAFIQFKSDGTGRISNADNMGPTNPSTMMPVDVAVGEEYITDFTFDPAAFTLAIPEPGLPALLGLGAFFLGLARRRKNSA